MMIIPRLQGNRKVIFIGNSLSNYGGGNIVGARRFPRTCYATLLAGIPYPLSFWSYAVPGVLTSSLVADYATNIAPSINDKDLVFFWGITTDVGAGGLTAIQAHAVNIQFVRLLKASGAVVINCTMIPRATPAYWTTGQAVNAMIIADAAAEGYTVCDFTQNSHFSDISDVADTNYYDVDGLHLQDLGYDSISSTASSTALPILNQ